ncbi:MAG: alpha/beta fold hydrolase [Chloroflexi bacterium]|nr:MAG: alpha/beta fold hydrolase [Chloroflexota bacterium]MBL1197136.1 alpha/beta fold hydrolase [Chloroflexota bacterium]NOH14431.1 alpha/beta fold hydrolase [Chloroflexota bacterium]
MQTYPDKFINVSDHRVRYWDVGQGPPVLLLHGVGCMVEVWYRNIPALAKKHRVIALDFLGHGYSSKPKKFMGLGMVGEFLQSFFQEIGVNEKVSLIGNSLGGGISLTFALQRPEMVNRLVLVSSGGLGRDIPILLRLVSNLPIPLVWLPPAPRRLLRFFLDNAVYTSEVITDEMFEAFQDLYKDMETRLSLMRILNYLIGLHGANPAMVDPILENIDSLDMPILLTWGEQDVVLPVRHGHWAVEALPNAQLQVFNPGGHMTFMEYPDEWNEIVLEFLG